MTSGIYEIVHKESGKRYVGSSRRIEIRWEEHRSNLIGNCHDNVHLQRVWNRDGADAFSFRVVEECPEETLLDTEQSYLDALEELYNIRRDVRRPPSPKGRTLSDEHRRKISEGNRGKPLSEERRGKISESHLGKKMPTQSDEHRRKNSEAHRGRILSKESKLQMAESVRRARLSLSPEKKAERAAKVRATWAAKKA